MIFTSVLYDGEFFASVFKIVIFTNILYGGEFLASVSCNSDVYKYIVG